MGVAAGPSPGVGYSSTSGGVRFSLDKAGAGSAVNDTTRELGATLGNAVIGSVFSSVYVHALADKPIFQTLPVSARAGTEDSVVARRVWRRPWGEKGGAFFSEVLNASLSGLSTACLVVAAVAAVAMFALRFLPARATD